MIPISFFEQLVKLKKIIFSSPVYIGLLIIFVLLLLFQILNVKRNNKIVVIMLSVLFFGLLLFAILGYHKVLFFGISNILDIVVLNLYFPSFAMYVIVITFSYFIFIITTFGKRFTPIVKRINSVFFVLIQFLFSLFLILVITKDIDVSTRINIYSNTEMTSILQVSMILFLFWLLALLLVYYIKIIKKNFVKKD